MTQVRLKPKAPRPLGLESSTLPLSHCAPKFYMSLKEQILHKELSLALYYTETIINSFENSMKSDICSIENSVGPDQLASSEASSADQDPYCFPFNMGVHNYHAETIYKLS